MSYKSKTIMKVAVIILATAFAAYYFIGEHHKFILGIGVLIIFMLFALLDPPNTQKEFSTSELREATNHLKGRNIGMPNADDNYGIPEKQPLVDVETKDKEK